MGARWPWAGLGVGVRGRRERWARLGHRVVGHLSRHDVLVVDRGARVLGRLLHLALVAVVADLQERNEAGETVLLGRLALDVG